MRISTVVARTLRAGSALRRRHRRPVALRVGIDLVDVADVAETLESSRAERYLTRVYTPAEVRDCTSAGRLDASRLAARFAAKEAVMKALDVGGRAVPWRTIEVRKHESGRPALALHGPAAAVARAEGLTTFALSLTHESRYASAFVVAS